MAMTTAQLEELAYNILVEECGNENTAANVMRYYANVLRFDTTDHIIARGMIHTYEDGFDDGYHECLNDSVYHYLA